MAANVPSTLTAFLLPYAAHLRSRGWTVDAAANGAPEEPRIVDAFDDVHHVPWTRRPRDLVNLVAAPPALRSIVRDGRYDVVHVHDPVASFVTRFALRDRWRVGTPAVVHTAHGFHFQPGDPPWPAWGFRVLEWLAARWTDHLIVINDDDERAASTFPLAGRLHRHPSIGVDLDRFRADRVPLGAVRALRRTLGVPDEGTLFSVVAELNPGKRHRDAIDAFALAAIPTSTLAFAGVGPEEARLRRQARARGVADAVCFLGYRDDVPTLLRASQATLLPSEREGLPRCILEALAMEVPVIAANVRGTRDLLRGTPSIVHDVGDVQAIADGLRSVAVDRDRAEAWGRAARVAVLDHALPHLLRLHEQIYRDALAGVRPPALHALVGASAGDVD